MNLIIYVAIFLTGTVFGSFFTLAVYRIPRKENILYGRSHCTTCNHRLEFWDLIPVLSYIFLGGKCRYCKEKIRIRYLLLEIFSGVVFLTIALTYGIEDLISLSFIYLFIAGLFIIAGIDKENTYIQGEVLLYEFCIIIAYLLYAYFVNNVACNLVWLFIIPTVLLTLIKCIYLSNIKKAPYGFYTVIIAILFIMTYPLLTELT